MFFLAGGDEAGLVYLRCEKQQVAALGEYLLALLDDLSPDVEPTPGHGSVTPLPFAWDVGSIGVKYDEPEGRIVVVLEELAGEDDKPATARFCFTRRRRPPSPASLDLVSKGRPDCGFCGLPIDLRRARMPEDELTPLDGPAALEVLRSGEIEVLGRMPWSSNATLLVEVRRRRRRLRAVYKPRQGAPAVGLPGGARPAGGGGLRAVVLAGMGHRARDGAAGRGRPPVRDGVAAAVRAFDVDAHYFTLLEEPARHAVLRTICCFDLLANSADRKGGHCLAGDDGRVWAVDNGLTFHEEKPAR